MISFSNSGVLGATRLGGAYHVVMAPTSTDAFFDDSCFFYWTSSLLSTLTWVTSVLRDTRTSAIVQLLEEVLLPDGDPWPPAAQDERPARSG